MKHFSLGLVFGAAAGVAISLVKDKHGRRLGSQLREQVMATKEDAGNLSKAINHLKDAGQELSDALPHAERALTELQKEVEYYQMNISRQIIHLQDKTAALGHKDSDNNLDDHSKN